MQNKIQNFLLMTLGTVLMAVGVYFFKIPNGFSTGGVSGIATLFGNSSSFFTPAVLINIINAALLLLGFGILGRDVGFKTVYCSLAFSLFTLIFERLVPLSSPLTDQPFLELVYAILLTGIGSALLFQVGASSGGTDIVALILKKHTHLDVGKALLCTDTLIAASSFFVFGIKTGLYSLLGLFAKAFLVDSAIESINVCKSFMIVTKNPEPIVDYIINTMHRSATSVEGVGEYSHEGRRVIFTLCRRIEAVQLKQKLRSFDPDAFVIVQSTSEIIGRGFRSV